MNRLLSILVILICGCGSGYEPPHAISTNGFDERGMRFIPSVGSPSVVTAIQSDRLLVERISFSTSPIELLNGYVVGTRNGGAAFFDTNDSLRSYISLQSKEPVVELLTSQNTIIAVQSDGTITRLDTSGAEKWTLSISPTRSNSLLLDSMLVIGTDSLVFLLDLSDAHIIKAVKVTPNPLSLVYHRHSRSIIAALSWSSSNKTDSVIRFDVSGTITQRFGIERTRITSNITIINIEPLQLVFGGLTETDTLNSVRKPFLFIYEEGKQKKKIGADYIVMNVAANRDMLVQSGFREYEGELTSGIDAFMISDLSKQWQRRFSQPLTSAVAVSASNAYFTMSFATQAETPSSGLYIILDLETGKTDRESAIAGVRSGFTPGMPMPFTSSGLLLADASVPIIYKLQ